MALAPTIIGWREWVALPELGIAKIKAKIDTGARTSALHAFSLTTYKENNILKVAFDLHPFQGKKRKQVINCVADVIDYRWVTDSGGHQERRYVIHTPIMLGGHSWPIEITLTNRDNMRFRMLLGRSALKTVKAMRLLIDPAASYNLSK